MWAAPTARGEATGLLLSIPYDKEWKITVDGRVAVLSPAYGGSTSLIEVPAGEHKIEMTYGPTGLSMGAIASFISAIALTKFSGYQQGMPGMISPKRRGPTSYFKPRQKY